MKKQFLVDKGFQYVAYPFLTNKGQNYKFATLREDGEVKDIHGKHGKIDGRTLKDGYWVYSFVMLNEQTQEWEVIYIGKAEGESGLSGRFSSYMSGNPKHNKKNGPQNRSMYLRMLEWLPQGKQIQVYAFPVPESTTTKERFGVVKTFPQQEAKWYECTLLEIYEKMNKKLPLLNTQSSYSK
tara:strand:- start:62 stop:607 length:546 start_codon:yes stop_codon:yes gene_type:complete